MFTDAVLRRRANAVTATALVATLGFGSTALAASFSSTLSTPSAIAGCGAGCLTVNGQQTSSIGGAGTYAIVDAFGGAPNTGGGSFCVTLSPGSQLTLAFGSSPSTSSSIVMDTQGQFCGSPPPGPNSPATVVGPYTITSGTGGFAGASGSGTVTGTYTGGNTAQLVFSDISGTLTLPASGAGGGGGVGGVNFAATPELDSLLLFGSGVLGLAGYALARSWARSARRST